MNSKLIFFFLLVLSYTIGCTSKSIHLSPQEIGEMVEDVFSIYFPRGTNFEKGALFLDRNEFYVVYLKLQIDEGEWAQFLGLNSSVVQSYPGRPGAGVFPQRNGLSWWEIEEVEIMSMRSVHHVSFDPKLSPARGRSLSIFDRPFSDNSVTVYIYGHWVKE